MLKIPVSKDPALAPSLLNEWNRYREEVLPPAAPQRDVEACRRAFYQGARSMLKLLTGIRDLTRCDAEITEMYRRGGVEPHPAWLVSLGVNDWTAERAAIVKELEGR